MVRNILFVDSDTILSNAVAKSLAQYGENFAVITASDGFDAIKQLQNAPVSLVVAELVMPRMDGMSLISHMRAKYPDIPAVIISAMDEVRLQELARTSGIVNYLKKPFQSDKLVNVIHSVLHEEAAGGIMHDISPTVFLQLMEMDAKTCTIRLIDKTGRRGGIIYFQEGSLLDARINELHGIEAAYELFSWDAATIFIRNECEPRENSINSDLTPIIMKAVGMKDEAEPPLSEETPESPLDLDPAAEMPHMRIEPRIAALQKEMGTDLGLKRSYQDNRAARAVTELTELGAKEDYGAFNFGYLISHKGHRIIFSGQPPTVVDIAPACPPNTIIESLRGQGQ